MKLVGGDPALDFVNTVGGRSSVGAGTRVRADKLVSYGDLVAFGRHRGILEASVARALVRRARRRPQAARHALRRAISFREALFRTLLAAAREERPGVADLGLVNAEVRAARARETLAPDDGALHWEWQTPAASLDAPLWPVARAAAALLTSDERKHVRPCDGAGCGWLFLDQSRGRRRRWCSMEDCGNLDKVRRFRRRHEGGKGAGQTHPQ
jgi:predicted RNA-binding Zn ribbon-like protein